MFLLQPEVESLAMAPRIQSFTYTDTGDGVATLTRFNPSMDPSKKHFAESLKEDGTSVSRVFFETLKDAHEFGRLFLTRWKTGSL